MNELGIEPMLTKKEVMTILKISRTHLESMMRNGLVKYIDVALKGSKHKHARFKKEHIESLIDQPFV